MSVHRSPRTPLHGWNVLVTRPVDQAESLCALIEQAGGRPLRFPLLAIEPYGDPAAALDRLRRLDDCDWLVFVSVNAVRHAFALGDWWQGRQRPRIAAVGRGTAAALGQRGVEVDLSPKAQFNSESLLELPQFMRCAAQRFMIVRGHGGRELLAETLRQRGAAVEYVEVYRRVAPSASTARLIPAWRSGEVDALVLSSQEALKNLVDLLGPSHADLLRRTPVAVIGERLAAEARALGCQCLDIAAEASDAELCAAIVRLANSTRG